MGVPLSLIECFSVQEIRSLPDRLKGRVEVILWPSQARYLFNPASTAPDDGVSTLVPSDAGTSCCVGGAWVKENIGTGGGPDTDATPVIEGGRIISNATQPIVSTGTDITFTTVQDNENGVVNLGVDDRLLTAQTTGPFSITGRVEWEDGSDGTYHTLKLINITSGETLDLDIRTDFVVNDVDKACFVSCTAFLLAGQQVKLQAFTDAADNGAKVIFASLAMYLLAGGGVTSPAIGSPSGPAGGDLTGTYPNPSIALLAVTDAKVATANKDGANATPCMRTLGNGVGQAAPGDVNANPSTPGLVPTTPNDASMELAGDSTWRPRYDLYKAHTEFSPSLLDYAPFRGGSGWITQGTWAQVFTSDNQKWWQLTTGTSINSEGGVGASGSPGFTRLGRQPGWLCHVKTGPSLTNMRVFLGISYGDGTGALGAGAGLEKVGFFYGSDTSAGAGFWQFRVGKDATHETIVVTSVAIAVNTEYLLRWDASRWQSDGSIRFYINDVLVATFSDATKMDGSLDMDPQFLAQTLDTTAKSFYVGTNTVEMD